MDVSYLVLFFCVATTTISGEYKNVTKIRSIRHTLAAEVLKSTLNTTINTIVAVLPLKFAFCKLASVAKGKAKEELLKILGFHNESMIDNFYKQFQDIIGLLQSSDLTYLNKIYVDYSKPINNSFTENSIGLYGAHVEKVGFNYPKSAVSFINKEISAATLRRVEDVVGPNDITNQTSLLLVTAGHCKPTWEKPFDHKLTQMRTFRLLDNRKVEIPMMMTAESCLLYDARDFRVITIKLLHYGCSMTFIQPDFVSLDRIIYKLQDPTFMTNIKKKMKYRQVRIVMPRLKIKSKISLKEYLTTLGIKELFSRNTTGLNAILKETTENCSMFVSNVLQKFFIEMDEFGVSRVDKNARWGDTSAHREPPAMLEVALDRPFYFSINLELPTSEPSVNDVHELFTGVYYKPDDKQDIG